MALAAQHESKVNPAASSMLFHGMLETLVYAIVLYILPKELPLSM